MLVTVLDFTQIFLLNPPNNPMKMGTIFLSFQGEEVHLTHLFLVRLPTRWPSRRCRKQSGARPWAGRLASPPGPAWRARQGAGGPSRRPVPRCCSYLAPGWRPLRGLAHRPGSRPGNARPAVQTTRPRAPRSRCCTKAEEGRG